MSDVHQLFLDLLQHSVNVHASDLHLAAETEPFMRLHGKLQPFRPDKLTAQVLEEMAQAIMHQRQYQLFQEKFTMDLAYALPSGGRFRINVFRERGRVGMAIRRLDDKFRTMEELHVPPQVAGFADLRDGLVLVTGPTGSGKTTTLATLIHQINQTRAAHIITIEDPLEYQHRNLISLVRQRELHSDVLSFADAVRAALREDPDVILVGEMRDLETIRAAITAAETGHLVFSTLHTGDCAGALDRMIGVFPAEEQQSVRQQLSMVMRAVIAQRLLPTSDGLGRVPAMEILKVTTAVAHLIRTGKPQQIYSSIETGSAEGMQTFEQSLADLLVSGLVNREDAFRMARDPKILESRLRNFSPNGNPRNTPRDGHSPRRTH